MELSKMNLEEVNARLAELDEEVRSTQDVEVVNRNTEEKRSLLERKKELVDFEERSKLAQAINSGDVAVDKTVEIRKELTPMEEKKIYTPDTEEYRSAFYAMLAGNATAEQRTILASPISVDGDGTNDGAAIAIPKTLDVMIWDNIHEAHPIVKDVNVIASGVVMEVTKHTAIAVRVSAKRDAAATANAEANTFVKVTLAGKDYEKYVELTYAEAKMSAGALEQYLATEIAAELGEALAKDIFAQILTDAASNEVTTTNDLFADIKTALGKATMGGKKVIYAPSTSYFDIVGAIKNGSPFNIGNTLGVEVKLDDATSHVVVVDPKSFVLNQISAIQIESDREIKSHRVVISGYLRAEGCLRYNNAAAYIN